MTRATTTADLRTIDLFEDLDDEALAEWAAVTEPFTAAAGEIVADKGKREGVLLLFSGLVQTLLVEGGRTEPAGLHHPPTWMGAISVLTADRSASACGPRPSASSRASRPTTSAGSPSRTPASTSAS